MNSNSSRIAWLLLGLAWFGAAGSMLRGDDTLQGRLSIRETQPIEIPLSGVRNFYPGERLTISLTGQACVDHHRAERTSGFLLFKKHYTEDWHVYVPASNVLFHIRLYNGANSQLDQAISAPIAVQVPVDADVNRIGQPCTLQGFVDSPLINRNNTCPEVYFDVKVIVDSGPRMEAIRAYLGARGRHKSEIESVINLRLEQQFAGEVSEQIVQHYEQWYKDTDPNGEAETILALALRYNPRNVGAHNALARYFLSKGDPRAAGESKQALQLARQAAVTSPTPKAFLDLAQANIAAAVAIAQSSQNLDPESTTAADFYWAEAVKSAKSADDIRAVEQGLLGRSRLLERIRDRSALQSATLLLKEAIEVLPVVGSGVPLAISPNQRFLLSRKLTFGYSLQSGPLPKLGPGNCIVDPNGNSIRIWAMDDSTKRLVMQIGDRFYSTSIADPMNDQKYIGRLGEITMMQVKNGTLLAIRIVEDAAGTGGYKPEWFCIRLDAEYMQQIPIPLQDGPWSLVQAALSENGEFVAGVRMQKDGFSHVRIEVRKPIGEPVLSRVMAKRFLINGLLCLSDDGTKMVLQVAPGFPVVSATSSPPPPIAQLNSEYVYLDTLQPEPQGVRVFDDSQFVAPPILSSDGACIVGLGKTQVSFLDAATGQELGRFPVNALSPLSTIRPAGKDVIMLTAGEEGSPKSVMVVALDLVGRKARTTATVAVTDDAFPVLSTFLLTSDDKFVRPIRVQKETYFITDLSNATQPKSITTWRESPPQLPYETMDVLDDGVHFFRMNQGQTKLTIGNMEEGSFRDIMPPEGRRFYIFALLKGKNRWLLGEDALPFGAPADLAPEDLERARARRLAPITVTEFDGATEVARLNVSDNIITLPAGPGGIAARSNTSGVWMQYSVNSDLVLVKQEASDPGTTWTVWDFSANPVSPDTRKVFLKSDPSRLPLFLFQSSPFGGIRPKVAKLDGVPVLPIAHAPRIRSTVGPQLITQFGAAVGAAAGLFVDANIQSDFNVRQIEVSDDGTRWLLSVRRSLAEQPQISLLTLDPSGSRFSPDPRAIFSAYKYDDSKLLQRLTAGPEFLAYEKRDLQASTFACAGEDSQIIAYVSGDRVVVHNLRENRLMVTLPLGRPYFCNAKYVVTGDGENGFSVWDLARLQKALQTKAP